LLGPPGGFFLLPLGFPVGHATLKAVLQASVNLYTVPSSSCGFVMLSDGSMGRTDNGESRDNTVSMNLWSEKECSSDTAQFLIAPTSDSLASFSYECRNIAPIA